MKSLLRKINKVGICALLVPALFLGGSVVYGAQYAPYELQRNNRQLFDWRDFFQPESESSESESSESKPPEADSPESESSESESPRLRTPRFDSPESEPPVFQIPESMLPEFDSPDFDFRGFDWGEFFPNEYDTRDFVLPEIMNSYTYSSEYERYGLTYDREKGGYCHDGKLIGLLVDDHGSTRNRTLLSTDGEIHLKVVRDDDGKFTELAELSIDEYNEIMPGFENMLKNVQDRRAAQGTDNKQAASISAPAVRRPLPPRRAGSSKNP